MPRAEPEEAATLGAAGIQGLALRYANFYGPGTGVAPGGVLIELVRKRRLPIIGDGSGMWLFTRIRGASNAKAKRELGWELQYPSWRDGFRHDLTAPPDRKAASTHAGTP